MTQQRIAIGQIVHFVQPRPSHGELVPDTVHLPAIVTSLGTEPGLVNLVVFCDGRAEEPAAAGDERPTTQWATAVVYDENEMPLPNTWHWPELS